MGWARARLIHQDDPLHILSATGARLTDTPTLAVVALLACVGVVTLIRKRSDLLVVPAWLGIQVLGLAASRISPFSWYCSPLFPGIVLLAGVGAGALTFDRLAGRLHLACVAAMACALLADTGRAETRLLELAMAKRTEIYLSLGEQLRPRCRPGDRIFVGEAGAIGWQLLDQEIIDSSGINSSEVLEARQADHEALQAAHAESVPVEGSVAWVQQIIETSRPRLIVTFEPWLHVNELSEDEEFLRTYRRVPVNGADHLHVFARLP